MAELSQIAKIPHILNGYMHSLSQESRPLRWAACSQMPELHATFLSEKRKWPEISVFS